jgi:hypothetical protein
MEKERYGGTTGHPLLRNARSSSGWDVESANHGLIAAISPTTRGSRCGVAVAALWVAAA